MVFTVSRFILIFLIVLLLIPGKALAQDDIAQKDLGIDIDFYLYPTPGELFEVIDKEELSFNRNLINPAENEKNYILTKSKYLNLGVFMTDLAYCAFFSKRSKSLNYIKSISNLSSNLLISSELRSQLSQDVLDNVENMDTVYRITGKHYYDVMRELDENKSNNVIYIITTGAYIESFYIGLNTIDEFSLDNDVLQEIAKQKFSLYNLRKFSKHYVGDPNVADIIKYLEELIEIFDTFLEEEGTKRSFKITESGRIQFIGGPKIIMNKEQFENLKVTVEKIRNEIIN